MCWDRIEFILRIYWNSIKWTQLGIKWPLIKKNHFLFQASFLTKKININGNSISLSIWDTAGQERWEHIFILMKENTSLFLSYLSNYDFIMFDWFQISCLRTDLLSIIKWCYFSLWYNWSWFIPEGLYFFLIFLRLKASSSNHDLLTELFNFFLCKTFNFLGKKLGQRTEKNAGSWYCIDNRWK